MRNLQERMDFPDAPTSLSFSFINSTGKPLQSEIAGLPALFFNFFPLLFSLVGEAAPKFG